MRARVHSILLVASARQVKSCLSAVLPATLQHMLFHKIAIKCDVIEKRENEK